jgi:hypothetical protein
MAMFSVALETQAIYISHFCSMGAHGGQQKSATLNDNCCFGPNNGTRNVLFQQLRVNS